jgi:hypothetical protein
MAEEIYLNVRNFGAAGNGIQNDTSFVLNAIAAVPAGGGTVYFPSGDYKLTSSLASNGKSIYFIGEGQHTKLTFTGVNGIVINNSLAGFKLPCGIMRLHIRTTNNGLNTGILFTGPNETSIEPQLTIRDVFITGVDNATCWHTGINVSHGAQSIVDNFMIRGNTSNHAIQSYGMVFDDVSTDVKVCNGSVTWVNFGCEVAGASESVIMYATHFVMCNVGVTTANMAGGHHFVIDQSHIAARVSGIILGNATTQQGPNHSRITDCFFIRLPSGGAYTGLSLFSSRNIVTGNEFTFNETGQTETGIHVQGQSGIPAQWNLITNNLIFNTNTAILLGTNSDRNYVVNNMGSDNVAAVTNSGTNNTVTGNLLQS